MDKDKIFHLKSCCFALGLSYKGKAEPIEICGTGFLIDPEGYFITAEHVGDGMELILKNYRERGIEMEYRGFLFENIDDEHGELVGYKIEHGRSIEISIPELGDNIPLEHDLMISRLAGKHNLPFLNFDRPTKIEIFDEICMCGYPGGEFSMRTQDRSLGNRFSPVLQVGRISSLFPTDYSKNPFGIQTDIIGTGGSSGSPIVDFETEQVVGIAQQVIPASTDVNIRGTSGSAKIGLVWGISNYFVTDGISKMLKVLKSEFDENGRPLSTEKLPDKINIEDMFYPEKLK